MNLDTLYQEVILDHYKNPLNKKLSSTFDAQVHHINPSCGDEITLNLTAVNGVITAITPSGSFLNEIPLTLNISFWHLNTFFELEQNQLIVSIAFGIEE